MSEDNARPYEEAQRRLREITTLYEASQVCLSISDQKGLLTAIIEAAARATDATLGSVMLVDEEKGEYVFGAHYGLSQEAIAAVEAELHIPLGKGLVGAVVTTGQPLVLADVTTDPRWVPMEATESMHSFLGVPLIGREGQVLGALTLSRPEVDAFDEDHARLLSICANQAAMTIENARLYEQAQQEITERKRVIEALRESEERYRRLVELSFDAIAIHREGKIVYINAAGAELFGVSSPEELVGKPILDFVHPDYLEIVKARMLQALEGRVAPLIEEKLIRLDGTSVDAEVMEIPITYQGQSAVQVVVRDITERKRAEEALRESEEKYRTILEDIEEGYYEVDIAGNLTFFNDSLCRLLGYPEDEMIGMNNRQYMDDETAKAVYQTFNAVYRTGRPARAFDWEIIRKDGTRRFVESSVSLIGGSTGEPTGFRGIVRDITERKREETERERLLSTLERHNIQLQTATEISRSASTILDPEKLMNQAVNLIQERFDFYYVGLFLVDETGEYVVLQVGTGEAGRQMLEAGHRLVVGGESMVGWSAANAQARIALDVGKEAVRFDNPYLPDMRSEMALPLISRGQCIGALTIQSVGEAAFSKEDIAVLQTMADHLAIAIGNAQLYNAAQREIARRKQAEEALRESEERYRSIFENAPFSIWMCNGEGTITFANQATLDLFGVTDPTQTIGRYNVYRDMTETEKPLLAYFERAWAGEVVRYRQDLDMTTVKYDTARRETLHFYSTVFPIPASGGQRPSIVVMQEDITERVRAEEALRVSEERFALAVQGANDGIWDWDIQSNSLYWSPRFKELLGYADDELDVDFDTFESHLHPDDREPTYAAIEAYLKDRVPYDVEQRLRTKSGEYRWFHARGQALWDEAGSPVRMVGFTTDITERKQAEAERERLLAEMENLAKELAVLNELGQALTARLSVDEVLDEAYQQASRLVDTTNFYIALYDPEKDEITFPYTMDSEENDWSPLKGGKGLTGRVIETGKPLLLPIGATGFHREAGGEIQYNEVGKPALSWLGVPLMIGEQVLGVMAIQSYTTPGLYDEHDRDLLTAIASPTAIAIQNARLFEETQARTEELAVLNELGQALTARLSVEEVLDEACRQASRLVDTTNFYIGLYDPEKDEITFPFNVSESEIDDQITVMSASQGITGYIVRNRTNVLLGGEDALEWEAEMGIETVGQEAPSWLGVPLMIGDRVLGVMVVQSYTIPDLYDEHDRDLLMAIASPTAIAIQNARLFEETQARTEEMAALREVNLATLSTLERDQVFEVMLDQLGKVIDYDNAAIKIITPDGIDKMIAGRGPVIYDQAMWDGFDVKDSKLVQEMKETGQTVVVHDVHTDERYARIGDWEAFHSWVGAPLFVRGDFTGYLMVEKTSLGFYDEHAAQLLSDFARAAAIAIENARLYEDIRRERDYSQTLIATANALVVGLDLEGCITLFNDFCAEITGYSQEEVLGQDWFTTLVPERRRLPSKQVFRELVEQGLPSHHESLILTKDGRERVIAWSNTLICDAEGRPASALAIGQDVTERKRAEEALRESEERYRALYEDNPSMYFTVDTEGTVLSVNRFGAEQLGYTVEELVGQSVLNVFYADDKKAVLQQLAMCLQNPTQIARWEFRKVRKDGSMLWVKEAVRAVQDIDGNTVVLVVCEDITERKKLEEQLRQAQKMDAIGTLAGGIAHDFNNLLTPIGGFAELLLWKAPEGSQQHEYLRQIKVAAERAAALTSRLLTFARRDRVEVHSLSLNDVVREVIGLLGRTIDKAIAIEPYLADDLATVEGDTSQLHQMLLNLCLNARDAMPDGGRLIIETRNMALNKAKARTDLDLEAGQYVLLSVTDTGSGMDAEIRQHLFEPFFTTKEQGRGLGLAMTYGIVRGHGGTIHVYSEPGQGSTFKVYLPVAGRPAVSTVPEEAEFVGGTETVLVVDDEGSVRELLRRILEEGGYTVLLATDGVEAVELYSRLGAEIDLVVLDIIMPRMGGRKTYERLRGINPEVKVLLSSGYSENGQARDILTAGARDFLQKPYDLRAVLSKVRDVLDG